MKSFLLSLAVVLFVACASETEQQSLDNVADIYNATVSYSKGFNNTGTEAEKSFNVKVSGSALIDSLQPTVTTANIAMLVYEGLTTDEQKNYTKIDVELVNAKNDTVAYFYTMDGLKELSHKSANFKEFSESVVSGNYKRIDEIQDENDLKEPMSELINKKIQFLEQEYGSLKGYKPFGIGELSNAAGETAYQYQGFFIFAKKDIPYIINIDAAPKRDKLVGIRFFN